MRRFLLLAPLAVLPAAAAADCGPNPVPRASGVPIEDYPALICEGLDADGFDARRSGDRAGFEIRGDATVLGEVTVAVNGFTWVRDGALLQPDGGSSGVETGRTALRLLTTGPLVVDDGADIRSDGDTVVIDSPFGLTVDNAGDILSANGAGIAGAFDTQSVPYVTSDTIFNDGVVIGETAGIDLVQRGFATITNRGNVRANDGPGIVATGDVRIRNWRGAPFPAAAIQGNSEGILSFGTLDLWNQTIVTGQTGVALVDGEVLNRGFIGNLGGGPGTVGIRLIPLGGRVEVRNEGTIQGAIGIDGFRRALGDGFIDISSDTALRYVQTYDGRLRGIRGTAFTLSDADDEVRLGSGSIAGRGLFGGGDDLLAFSSGRVFPEDGVEGLEFFARGQEDYGYFDGGAGFDTALFPEDLFTDILGAQFGLDRAILTFDTPERTRLELVNFESFGFDDPDGGRDPIFYTFQELAERLTPAPIPLPAAGWLMLAGLGALGLRGRRRG